MHMRRLWLIPALSLALAAPAAAAKGKGKDKNNKKNDPNSWSNADLGRGRDGAHWSDDSRFRGLDRNRDVHPGGNDSGRADADRDAD